MPLEIQMTTTTKMTTMATSTTAVVLGLASALSADVTIANYSSGSQYSYYVEHMPDFDQVREGLAKDTNDDPGGMYCVPTSCVDLLAYMASHGEPGIGPDFADWEAEEDYEAVTDFIDFVATGMLTSGHHGTTMVGAYLFMLPYVYFGTSGRFTVECEMWSPWNVVTLREMAQSAIWDESIQAVCYGRYEHVGWTASGKRVIKRAGGHCMAFTGAERSGSYRHIWAMDPDDSSNASAQSNFGVEDWDVEWMSDLKVAPTVGLSIFATTQGMNRIMRGSSDFRLIDGRLAIRPTGCTSWGPFAGDQTGIFTRSWSIERGRIDLSSASAAPFIPWKVFKAPSGAVVAIELKTDGPAAAWFEIKEGDSSQMKSALALSQFDFKDATYSVERSLLLLGKDGNLYGLSDFDTPDADTLREDAIEPRVLMQGLQGFDLMAHNTTSGETAFLDRSERKMLVVGRYFEETRTVNIPANVPLGGANDEGLLDFKVGPDGTAFFKLPGANELWMVKDQPNARGELLGTLYAQELRGYDLDDNANILINDNGIVRCFSLTPEGLVETGAEASAFAGQQVEYGLVLDRSSSNYDPRQHDTEGWRQNLENESCLDECEENTPDIDGNGIVNGADLTLLLGDWGQENSPADLDDDGFVTGADLALLLGAFNS